MKIYIASRYKRHILNTAIEAELKKVCDVFLPERLEMEEATPEQQTNVRDACIEQINTSDIVLLVEPSGNDVSFEIGYAYMQKQMKDRKHIRIIRIGKPDKKSAMIDPCIDVSFNDAIEGENIGDEFPELIKYLKNNL